MTHKFKLLVLNGPNLNLLGIREPSIYGAMTYPELCDFIQKDADQLGVEVKFFQSNHEGAIIDAIHGAYDKMDGIIINAGAYTHYSYAILDALKSVGLPAAEVHISDIEHREPFRKISVIRPACCVCISGRGFQGYLDAMRALLDFIQNR